MREPLHNLLATVFSFQIQYKTILFYFSIINPLTPGLLIQQKDQESQQAKENNYVYYQAGNTLSLAINF